MTAPTKAQGGESARRTTQYRALLFGLLATCALVALDLARRPAPLPAALAAFTTATPVAAGPQGDAPPATASLQPLGRGQIPMPPHTPAAHASSLLAMPPGHASALLAFWFAGAGESTPDVQIAASSFDRASQQWQPAQFVVNRDVMGQQLGFGLRRLGNPVAWRDAQGRIHLFVVATGLGGWAASRILHLRQAGHPDDITPLKFEALRVLPLSWLWNISHLVRTAPLPLADGGMLLPVYFELGIKYPMALRFDAQGEFRGMVRISAQKHLLQPTLLMAGERHWLALMRDQRPQGKVGTAETRDAGQTWTDLPDLALINPDASIAGLTLPNGQMLLAHNSSPHSRQVLDLSGSANGRDWKLLQTLERGSTPSEYSYPAMVWADGSLWVSYTDQRRAITWQRFRLLAP